MAEITEKPKPVTPPEQRQTTAPENDGADETRQEERKPEPGQALLEALKSFPLIKDLSQEIADLVPGFPDLKLDGQLDPAPGSEPGPQTGDKSDPGDSVTPDLVITGGEEGGGESKGIKEHLKYVTQPTEFTATGGESLDAVARAQAKEFLGESFAQFESDPMLMKNWVDAFKKSVATINGISTDATLQSGAKIILPGQSPDGEPMYEKDGTVTAWGLDSTLTLQRDGTQKLEWNSGAFSITAGDGSNTARDENGVNSTTRKVAEDTWLTERSDGTYERKNLKTGESESRNRDGIVSSTKDGVTTTRYSDGSVMVLNKDMSTVYTLPDKSVERTDPHGKMEKFDEDGNLIGRGIGNGRFKIEFHTKDGTTTSEVSSINRSEFRFTLTEKGGKIQLQEKDSPEKLEFVSTKEFEPVKAQREKLLELAGKSIDDPIVLAKFKADMIRFENRAMEREMPPEQVKATYESVQKLFAENPDAPIDKTKRAQIATEVMSDVAEPYTVSQGFHGTCNVKIMHVLMAAKNPEKLAGMVAEVADTGKYTLPSGTKVDVPPGTLVPALDAMSNPRSNGERGFAGQLFDTTVINALMKDNNAPFHLDQLPNNPPLQGYKTGDILVDNETGKPLVKYNGDVQEFGGLHSSDIVKAYGLIMGEAKAGADWLLDPNWKPPRAGIKGFDSSEEFHDILTKLGKNGDFPIAVRVDTRMPPFWEDSGAGIAGGSGGGHVINITDYDPKTRKVMIDNQWSTHRDRLTADAGIPVDQLYRASLYTDKLVEQISEDIERKGSKLDPSALMLKELSTAFEGGDPTLFEEEYLQEARTFGRVFGATNEGDATNKEYREIFDKLRPIGKLMAFETLLGENAVGRTVSTETFNSELAKIADMFKVTEPDVYRQLRHKPETLADGKAVGMLTELPNETDYTDTGKLETLRLIAKLSAEQRESVISLIRRDVAVRIAEAKKFSGYAE